MVDFKADERLNTLNHSCAHVMAQAVKHLYPEAKFWVGPVVKEGFYYDIDLGDTAVNDDVIAAIEKEMKKIAKSGKKIMRREVSKAEAMEMFKNDEYKLDLISDLEDGNITVYDQGDFTDLCRGPHVDNVKLCRNFKLIRHSGAYWKGDSKNKVLQRIYGVCFPTAEELEAVREHCAKHGVNVALSDVFAKGGEGGIDLAKEVIALADSGESKFAPIYPLDMSLKGKIETIAKEIYGADGVNYTKEADKALKEFEELGYGNLPICMAKTQYSFSDDPALLGRPSGFKITIRNCRIAAGAGFIVVLTGDVMTMPGLPKVPAAEKIDVTDDGVISGLF